MTNPPERRGRHAAEVPSKTHGRRRAPDPVSDAANILPLTDSIPVVKFGERRSALELERELVADAVASRKPRHSAVAAAASTGLIMVSAMSGTIANATIEAKAPTAGSEAGTGMLRLVPSEPDAMLISADEHQQLRHARVEVTTEPAPAPEPEPVPVQEEPAPVYIIPEPPAAPPRSFVRETSQFILGGYAYETPSVPPPPAPAPASNKGQAILSAAMGQLGVWQDCTMLVTNSLAAVGIYFHDWPAGYMGLGTVIDASQAMPGDLLYYMDGGSGVPHIAVYAGNGQAVHGGWNGNQTVVFSAYVGSGPTFIRVA
jgi:hypothetical protein